jgi:hypothetical protein
MRHHLRPPPAQPKDYHWLKMVGALALAWFLLWFAIVFVIATKAEAHDAPISIAQPKGWTYPSTCCSGLDCRPVGSSATPQAKVKVFDVPGGYQISTTKEFIATGDKRIHDSPDADFHWCSTNAGADDGKTLCLYVPTRGS